MFITIVELKCIACNTTIVRKQKDDGTYEQSKNCPKCGKKSSLDIKKLKEKNRRIKK
jgi:DNA replicative helicase MCM subunit Mcm2 (Cdc46/Mcm family)